MASITRRERILKQLESAATLGQIASLLKARNLPYSATGWAAMRETRLLPALKDGRLTETDLIAILRESEEYGHQHIFLYTASKTYASSIVNDNTLSATLKKLGRNDLLDGPVIVDEPPGRVLTDARIDSSTGNRSAIFKAVETVTFVRSLGEVEEEAGGRFFTKKFERVKERAISTLVVHDDGLVELRISSHDFSSTYQDRAEDLWTFFNPLVDRLACENTSITRAQNMFWTNPEEYKDKIKYGDSRVRDLNGNTALFASGGENKNLFDAPNATAGFDAFYGDEGTCDRSNLWFKKVSNENKNGPSKEIHVQFSGSVNEFTVPVACNRKDYEYVLDEIRRANRRTS